MSPLLVVLVVLAVVGLVTWSLVAHRRERQARQLALERLGFRPCPEERESVLDTVRRIENNPECRYEVRDLHRLGGTRPVYCYVKMRHWDAEDTPSVAEDEVLFMPKRPSAAPLVLVVKPSSLAPGLATRMLGALAGVPWDAQADDLRRLELPPDLRDTNVLAALAPPAAGLYELIDAGTLSVVQGLGDAGALFVRFRDSWCSVSGTSRQLPFRLEELVARLRPLL